MKSDRREIGHAFDIRQEWMSNRKFVKSCETGGTPHSRLVDAESLGEAIAMTRQQVWRLHRMGKIPVVKVGYRTHRYDIDAVLAALGGAK